MRFFKYGLMVFSAALVPALCQASDPWTADPHKPPDYQVARLTADGQVKNRITTDVLTPDQYCHDPVALPWEDKSKRKPTVALRIRDLRTNKVRIYRCS